MRTKVKKKSQHELQLALTYFLRVVAVNCATDTDLGPFPGTVEASVGYSKAMLQLQHSLVYMQTRNKP